MEIKRTEDDSNTLYSERYGEYYHCKGGALAKAQHIFLEPVEISTRCSSQRELRILEVGFGAGLNFFVTADALVRTPHRLEYTALEHDLLPVETFRELQYDRQIQTKSILETFLSERDMLPSPLEDGEYRLSVDPLVSLRLLMGDASQAALPKAYYDWVYLDPFSPNSNPELWTDDFLGMVYRSLLDGGGLSTYCVKGEVRRTLKRAGFEVFKRPGILYKREVTVARKPNAQDMEETS